MKITNLAFSLNDWSWGITVNSLFGQFNGQFEVSSFEFGDWQSKSFPFDGDIILSQNVTQLKYIKPLEKTIARMGGNRSFKTRYAKLYCECMADCYALIATNGLLQEIGRTVNPNTYLILNGLDLDTWKPLKSRKWRINKPKIGFIGNITSTEKRIYKGFDYVKEACDSLGLELVEALYREKQIPHNQMRELFWNNIDIFILPTLGEGCSNSIMEALACGVPVITTEVAGIHGETLNHGENVLFCERSTESIESQIKSLLGNKSLFDKLSQNGREYAEKYHDVTKIAKQYAQIFNNCYFSQEHTIG